MTRSQNKFGKRWTRLATAALVLAFSVSGVARAQGIAAGLPGANRSVSKSIVKQLTGKTAKSKPQPTAKTKPQPTTRRRLSSEQVAERLMYSTCHIIAFKGGRPFWSGTGWVLDAKKRLIVTNHHVAIGIQSTPPNELRIYLPVKRNGQWENSLRYYFASVRYGKGTVIATTRQHDLALVQLDYLPSNVLALPMAAKSPATGSRLHTVGGKPAGSDNLWSYSDGHVRQVGAGGHGLGNNSRTIQSTLATNPGNSGGPVVNDFGEIVGVHAASSRRGKNTTTHIDVLALRGFLGKSMPLVKPQTANQFYLRGRNRADDKQYSLALQDFSAAIRLNPRLAAAYTQRGLAFLFKGDSRTAAGDLNYAIEIDPTNAEAFAARGLYYRSLKQYTKAVTDYSNAIRFDSKNARYYNGRGIVELNNRNVRGSYKDFVQATKLQPRNPIYFFNRGLSERLLRGYQASIASFNKAAELGLRSSTLFNQAGLSYLGAKEYQSAFKMFNAANATYKKQKGKDNSEYLKNMGTALFRSGQLQKAYDYLTAAIKLDPKNAELYALRGQIAKKAGDATKAKANFQTAAQLDPKKYGNRTAGNSQQPNRNNLTNVSTTSSNGQTASIKSDRRVLGAWRCVGTYKGTRMRIGAAFTKNGYFALHFRADNGGESRMSGVFIAKGGKIYIKTAKGKVEAYRYGFQRGQLWIDVQGTGVALYFTKRS